MFSACTLSMAEKRVFLFTDDDSPTAGDLALREQALQRTKDLTELKVGFYLYPMTRADRAFDSTLFYDELMRINHHDELEFDSYIIAPGELLDELAHRGAQARLQAARARALLRSASVAPAAAMSSSASTSSRSCRRRKSRTPPRSTRAICSRSKPTRAGCARTPARCCSRRRCSTRSTMAASASSSRPLSCQQIKRTAAEPGLELFGFKPRSALKFHHNIKHSAFLFPNEAVVRGGTKAFAALVEQMAALDRVAIGALAPRANAAARLVALLPQREESDEHGNPLLPCGLCVIPLPFADDIRRLELPPLPTPSSELRSAMKAVVKTVELNDISLADPALQKTYVNLQAIALERDDVIDSR
jgi:ATP-dependent DNA helicase 2 subunit 1